MLGQPAKSHTVTCPHCGEDVAQKPGAGRVRLYCDPEAGRQWRRKMRSLGFPV